MTVAISISSQVLGITTPSLTCLGWDDPFVFKKLEANYWCHGPAFFKLFPEVLVVLASAEGCANAHVYIHAYANCTYKIQVNSQTFLSLDHYVIDLKMQTCK